MSTIIETIRVPEYPLHLKHKVIIKAFKLLGVAQVILIINDHDPIPLHFQLDSMFPGQFTWKYEKRGPDTYQIRIEKI